jgi:hypothetical protein
MKQPKVKRPYHLDTETMSAFYETEQEAMQEYESWKQFYLDNVGKYGTHKITVTRHKKQLASCIVEG